MVISETNWFGNHRTGISENNSKTIKLGLVMLCVMVTLGIWGQNKVGLFKKNLTSLNNKESRSFFLGIWSLPSVKFEEISVFKALRRKKSQQ